MNTAVIGIGTNLGDRMKNINRAVRALSLLPSTSVTAASSVYETEPVGYSEQGAFYNANVILETTLSPQALLGACLGIEAAAGRLRSIKNGPRILDLDLLLYETVKSDLFELTLPHPRICERAFVMVPLLELFPSGRAPGLFFLPHLRELSTDGVRKTEEKIVIPN